jgi:AcrR family transcriptional regulator
MAAAPNRPGSDGDVSLMPGETVRRYRDHGIRPRALLAAIELLTNEGWEAVTQPKVAERAGLGRATIYRYWPDRTALVHDAVTAHMAVTRHTDVTGDLRADLVAELTNLFFELTERDLGPVLAALVDRAEWEPDLQHIKSEIARRGVSVVQTLLTAAVERGDLAPDTDRDAAVSVLVGPLLYRRLISGEPLDQPFVEWLVDNFLTSEANPHGS